MAILISQKKAGANLSNSADNAYVFHAEQAASTSTNLFFGLADTAEELSYSGGNLKVADVSTNDKIIITDLDMFSAGNNPVNIKTVGNSVVLTTNAGKSYTFASIANGEHFDLVLGTPTLVAPLPPALTIARTGDVYTYTSSEVAGSPKTITNSNVAIDVLPVLVSQTINANGALVMTFSEVPTFNASQTIATITGVDGLTRAIITTSTASTFVAAGGTTGGTTTLSGNVLTFVPTVNFLTGADYTVALTAAQITDATPNTLVGTATNTSSRAVNGSITAPVNFATANDDVINANQGAVGGALVSLSASGGNDEFVIVADTAHAANVIIQNFVPATNVVNSGDRLVFDAANPATLDNIYSITDSYVQGSNATFDITLERNSDGNVQHITIPGFSYTSHVGNTVAGSNTWGASIDTFADLTAFLGTNAIVYINDKVSVDVTAPIAPTTLNLATADDTGSSNSDNLTKNTTGLTIDGVAVTGDTVILYDTDGTTVLGSGTAVANAFSIDISLAASGTPHSITAKSMDAAGNLGVASSALSITVDTTAPTASLINVASGTTITATNSEVGTVGIYATTTGGGNTVGALIGSAATTTAGGAGVVTVAAATPTVAFGTLEVRDAAGNAASSTAGVILGTTGNDVITEATPGQLIFGFAGADAFTLNAHTISSTTLSKIADYTVNSAGEQLVAGGSAAAWANQAASGITTTATDLSEWGITSGVATRASATVSDFYAAFAGATGSAGAVAAFEDGGNTYIFGEGATASDSDNTAIELIGITGITAVATTQAATTIQIA